MGHYDSCYEDRFEEERQHRRKRLPGRLKKIAEAMRTLGMMGASDIEEAIHYLKED